MTDNPISKTSADLFGFLPYIEELHAAVGRADPLPLTVGVFGSWGSGKTSFLKMWQDLLSFAPQDRTIWFNPWKYDQKVEVWAALVQSILAEVAVDESRGEKAAKLARSATWLGLKAGLGIVTNLSTGGLVDASRVDQAIAAMSDSNAKHYRDLNRFEEDFADAVADLVGAEGRLFVFVDDLDRCTPAAAVSVLEALKLFIGDARCVFVLAMDFDLLSSVAAAKLGDAAAASGAAYLEKIVQLPFFLPGISFTAIRRTLQAHVGELQYNEAFWELVEIGFGNNPRRVKRFINVFNLAYAVIARDGPLSATMTAARQLQLAELLIIRSEHRDLFRHLLRHPGDWQRLEQSAVVREGAALTAEPHPELAQFLGNEALVRLLGTQPGSWRSHPAAPTRAEVMQLLTAARLTFPVPDLSDVADERTTDSA